MAFFKVQVIERQLRLVFEDSSTRNSFSVGAAQELSAHLHQYRNQFDVLIVSARGRVFCSGGNLADYSKMNESEAGLSANRQIASSLQELALLPVPTFCFVEGDVFGGGVEVLSAFDFVYTAPHVILSLWQRRIGLTFGWGGGARLKRRLGEKRLVQLSLTAESVCAREALSMGLIDGIMMAGGAEVTFARHWKKLALLPRTPLAALKRWVSNEEQALFENVWWNEEHQAALKQFLMKR